MPKRQMPLFAIMFLVGLGIFPKLILDFLAPASGGDWDQSYLPVALNILYNGCVSLSDPLVADCLPTWGGNHLPGYPMFIASIWFFFPESITALLVAQTLVYAASVIYFVRALSFFSLHRAALVAICIALMLSPQLLAWSRFTQTETLNIAVSLWLFAELALSLRDGKLRLISLGLVLALAVFIRYDAILLALPTAFVGFRIHAPGTALKKGLIIALIAAAPLAGWAARSVSLGLSATPDLAWNKYGGRGYLSWAFTWTTSQYQYPDWQYPIASANYSRIKIDDGIYINESERATVKSLLDELATYDRKVMPAHIDEAFAELAAARKISYPIRTWLILPAVRAWNLWFNPYNSYGWPVSVGSVWPDKLTKNASRWQRAVEIAMQNPLVLLIKGGNAVWRLAGLVGAFFLYGRIRRLISFEPTRTFVASVLAFTAARTLFFAEIAFVEARYMLPAVALIEVSLILLIAEFYQLRTAEFDRRPSLPD